MNLEPGNEIIFTGGYGCGYVNGGCKECPHYKGKRVFVKYVKEGRVHFRNNDGSSTCKCPISNVSLAKVTDWKKRIER